MKRKILVKSRVVLDQGGRGIHLQFWEKTFWVFGRWYTWGSLSSLEKISDEAICQINDAAIQKVVWGLVRKMRKTN